MKIDIDVIHRFKVIGLFFLQFYKISTGTLLTIFIPQSCGEEICTLKQNYENNEIYHEMVLYWNMLTMFFFICSYMIELRREEWCIKYLDIDNDYSDNGLKEIIVKDKHLDMYMDRINKYYYNMIRVTGIFYFINLGATVKMLNTNYHSNSTISCFMSFSLLVLMKLYNSYTVAYESVHNDKMMSAYKNEFVSYNVIDDDYVQKKYGGNKNNRLEDVTFEEKKDEILEEEDILPIVKP